MATVATLATTQPGNEEYESSVDNLTSLTDQKRVMSVTPVPPEFRSSNGELQSV